MKQKISVGSPSRFTNGYVFLVLTSLGLAIFGVSIFGPFLFDDYGLILRNEYVQSLSHFLDYFTTNTRAGVFFNDNLYRPLTTTIYAIVYYFFNTHTAPYHLVNILFHIINAYIAYLLLTRLRFSQLTALIASVLFLVHPTQSESVAYISGLPDVSVGMFVLAGTLCFLNATAQNKRQIIWTPALFISFIFAVMSKESGVILAPLCALLMLFNWKTWDGKVKKRAISLISILFLLTSIYLILKFTIFNFSDTLGLMKEDSAYANSVSLRATTFISTLWKYAVIVFFPKNLYLLKESAIFETLTLASFFGLTVIIGGLISTLISLRRKRIFAFCFLWFFIGLIPVSGIFIPMNSVYFEHWLYLPLLGFTTYVGYLFEKTRLNYPGKRQLLFAIVLAVVLTLSTRSILRNYQWTNPVSFFQNELSYNQFAITYNQLGISYMDREKYSEALQAFNESLKLDPYYSLSHLNIAKIYMQFNQPDLALYHITYVLAQNPNDIPGLLTLEEIAKLSNKTEIAETLDGIVEQVKNGKKFTFEYLQALIAS